MATRHDDPAHLIRARKLREHSPETKCETWGCACTGSAVTFPAWSQWLCQACQELELAKHKAKSR